jgi:hypothetical protein
VHSCRIYDKTKEITVSHKDWMQAVWLRNGWDDTNRGRWPISPFWQAVQQVTEFGEAAEPAVREKKYAGDLKLICQMLTGCATTAAAYLANRLPDTDDGSLFLRWFYDWMGSYHTEKSLTFEGLRDGKRLRLGIISPETPRRHKGAEAHADDWRHR